MRGMFVAATLLIALLAGCVGDEPVNVAQEVDDEVITDPRDFSRSDGEGWHIHDYWGGQEELELLDMQRDPCACTVSYGGDQGTPLGTFIPDPEHVVPQGTAWVHVQGDWTIGSGDYDGVGLFVKTANMSDFVFVAPVEPNQVVTFESSHDDNDPPHQTLSLWEFQFRALSPDGEGSSATNFGSSMQVTVERGLEIPPWPPHPDFWNGANELVLAEHDHTVAYDTQGSLFHFCSGCVGGPWIADGEVVPFDADLIIIEVTATSELPVMFGFRGHGAESREWTEIEPTVDEPMRKVWHMDTGVFYGDSPYAKQSLWAFNLFKDQVRMDDTVTIGHWQGTYHSKVTAINEA